MGGEKWGKMRGKCGGNEGKWGGGGQITRIVGLGWTGLVSPFSPIFDHFPTFFLRSFHQCTPPPLALLPIKTMFFALFSPPPPNSSFFHRASKFSHTFPHFPPFFLNQPILDSAVTFRKRLFLRPVHPSPCWSLGDPHLVQHTGISEGGWVGGGYVWAENVADILAVKASTLSSYHPESFFYWCQVTGGGGGQKCQTNDPLLFW